MDANVAARAQWSRSGQLPHLAGRAGADRLFGYWRHPAVHRAPRPCPRCTHLAAASPLPAHAPLHAWPRWSWRSWAGRSRREGVMSSDAPAYGLWGLVIVNSVVFILFAYSFFKPRTGRDWRSFGAFSAFMVALFTEMYGFPLTIYFLSGWLQSRYPSVDWLSHDAGHLLEMMFGWKANPHFGPFHMLSFVLIGGGFVLIATGWRILYDAQKTNAMASTGVYSYVRHPQYVGFILVMFGFLLQWPTLLTLAMFPVLVYMYVRLARTEEREAIATFGDEYRAYMARVPGFFPRFGSRGGQAPA